MNFQQRFKGKTSVIDKEGIEGIVKQKALPIQKEFGNENNDIANQLNSRILLSQGKHNNSQMMKPYKSQSLKKTSSHQVTHSDIDLEQLRSKTKIITNIRQPSENLTSSSAQPHFQSKNVSQIRGSPKISGSNQSTAASLSHLKKNNDQLQSFSQVASLVEKHINGYDYRPEFSSHNNLSHAQIYNGNNNNNNGTVSTQSFKLNNKNDRQLMSQDQYNIFQNRVQSRLMSGAMHQQAQPILFSTGNYGSKIRSYNFDQMSSGDYSPLNYTGTYKLPQGMNQIIVPENYELIAVPRNQVINVNTPTSHSQIQSGYNSQNITSRFKLPMLQGNNNQYNYNGNDSHSNILPYQSQQLSSHPSDDQLLNSKYTNNLSTIVSKKNLINSGKSVLDSTPTLKPAKAPGISTYRYELDFMEEKHRDIIDNLEKIREKRVKK